MRQLGARGQVKVTVTVTLEAGVLQQKIKKHYLSV